MERLAPAHVPVYRTGEKRRTLWERCVERDQPVVAVRDATRGYIVRYDLQHLGTELDDQAVRELRERTRRARSYPTGTDPISESEGVGGEAGPVSGDLHAPTEREARELAATLSALVFDRTNWQ
jgi:hypothetical protein